MNLNSQIKQFFMENDYHKLADDISVIRKDGIPVFSNKGKGNVSVGALISGLWQASEALSSTVEERMNFDRFRLGFDSSREGLYVLPLNLLGDTYFLSAIYKSEMNPGKLKSRLRLIKKNLEIYLSAFSKDEDDSREGYLFENITDEEIDQLFQVSGV